MDSNNGLPLVASLDAVIERLPPREEAIVLRAMHQTLVDHGFCLTQETHAGPLLVFPSYFDRHRRDQIECSESSNPN